MPDSIAFQDTTRLWRQVCPAIILLAIFLAFPSRSQERLDVPNASFDVSDIHSWPVRSDGWDACILPGMEDEGVADRLTGFGTPYGVAQVPLHGNAFLGLVTRANGTWELVSETLNKPILKNHCYKLVVYLSYSPDMKSFVSWDTHELGFGNPVQLAIWGSNNPCEKETLLVRSFPVDHQDWRKYAFFFLSNGVFTHMTLEAEYAGDVSYNGNILLDHLYMIDVPCQEVPR